MWTGLADVDRLVKQGQVGQTWTEWWTGQSDADKSVRCGQNGGQDSQTGPV